MVDKVGYIQSASPATEWTNIVAAGEFAHGALGELIIRCDTDTRLSVGTGDPGDSLTAGGSVYANKAAKVLLAEESTQAIWVQTPATQSKIKVTVDDQSIDAVFATSSGSSNNHNGFADYNDAATATTPISLVADTWTTLTNDGLGAFTQEQLPYSVSTLLGSGGALDLTALPIGSDLLIRPDFTVTPSANNSALSFRFSVGAGGDAYTLEQQLGRLDLGAGVPYRFSLQALYVYVGDSNTKDNPVNLQIKLSGAGTAVNAGMAIKVYSR